MLQLHSCPLNTLINAHNTIQSIDHNTKQIMILPTKTLNINNQLTKEEETRFIHLLVSHATIFAWEYKDMKGIHHKIYTHNIYIEDV